MALTDKLTEIANAIRSSDGSTDSIAFTNFATRIKQLKRIMYQDAEPTYCEPKAQEAVDVARTYWIARASGRKFTYDSGKTFLNGNTLNDASGAGIIDCSTFIHLVMRGITYDMSPYASNKSANATYDSANLVTNTAKYTWADDNLRNSATIGGQVRYAADLAAYYWAQGRAFTDSSKRKPGDLIFHSTKDNGRFMGISHVSIVTEDIDSYFNVTDIKGKVVVRTQYASRNEDIVFFARPDYERLPNQTYTFNPDFNYLAYPWICGSSYTASSNVTLTASDGSLTTSSTGATTSTTFDLASSSFPLYLPAGTYKLSGAPAYQDRRARVDYSYWGLRLYPLDKRTITSQVIGYTAAGYSSPPTTSTTQTQALVWDKGYGATFTISTPMSFYANIYISKTPGSKAVAYNTTDTWVPKLVRTA